MSRMPRIGELRTELDLEEPIGIPDGQGGRVIAWSKLATVYARVVALRRRESVEDGRLTGLVTHVITLRNRDDVTSGMRFVSGARVFRILATEPFDQTGRFLDCLAEEER